MRKNKFDYQRDINPMRIELAKRFPKCFVLPGAYGGGKTRKKPLKIGISQDVISLCPDLNPDLIRVAIADYCSGEKYMKCTIPGKHRVDLQGFPVGIVTESDFRFQKQRHYQELQQRRERNVKRS